MCGKGGRTSDINVEKSDSDSDSEAGDIGGFDGFADEINIDTIPRVEVLYMYGIVVH